MPGKNPLEESESISIGIDKKKMHPKSLANLKPYPKGVSGNVNGPRYKWDLLKKELNKLGDEEALDYSGKPIGTLRTRVRKRIWDEALKGNMKFIQLLAGLGCLDGKQ